MKSIETEGKTVEQAIELGLYKLEMERDQVTIQILDQGGLFSKARVKISTGKQTDGEMEVQKFFDQLIAAMGLSCFASVEETEKEYKVNLSGNDVGVMIGKHGDILSAIQFLSSQILCRGKSHAEYKRVVVDSSNYLSRREESLKVLARTSASRAIREKKPVKLEYMNARERRVIHAELAENKKVTTQSQGEEPRRYVVIQPVKEQKETNDNPFEVPQRDTND